MPEPPAPEAAAEVIPFPRARGTSPSEALNAASVRPASVLAEVRSAPRLGGAPARDPHLAGAPSLGAHGGGESKTARRRPALRLIVGGRSDAGQASVELVALLPLIALILALALQAVLAGEALWNVRVASRAAARANAVGNDAATAARAHLPGRLEQGLKVDAGTDGNVRVSLRVPTVIPALGVGRVAATSHFRPQG